METKQYTVAELREKLAEAQKALAAFKPSEADAARLFDEELRGAPGDVDVCGQHCDAGAAFRQYHPYAYEQELLNWTDRAMEDRPEIFNGYLDLADAVEILASDLEDAETPPSA